ncbi:hypothetical protein M2323_002147 [Rhodoblastus acidophilus]|uniref:hypothetical protein n=1 Tax=Rhodoblastus acidophilus TaxID=1074 RepID=UPI00222547D9|nr:hypothetical protein [Rhodoblastus acidophilus]MCW2284304.1 hypothetical protein [Rhodoblastus acidophilus]MCW2333218.1 hypothetical protein [Rhodoblastus acidophilus]
MINLRELRFWTSLLIAGLCVLAANLAVPALRYGLATSGADPQNVEVRMTPLFGETGVGVAARQFVLIFNYPKGFAERVGALKGFLSLKPLAAGGWLDLATASQKAGLPMAQVSSALALSTVSGPNEARIMAGRAVFGLPLWDKLPPDVRRGLVGDLVGGWEAVVEPERQELTALLAVASEKARSEILAALLLAGKPAAPIVSALGLEPEKQENSAKTPATAVSDDQGGDR